MSQLKPAVSFQDLIVWQKAHRFVLGVYRYTATFPREELYGLSSQFRRAAVSIAANIAEGFKKRSELEKARILNIAQGSLEECAYFLILSKDLGYGENSELHFLLDDTARLLQAYRQAITKNLGRNTKNQSSNENNT
ncbi:MAG: four helix bundle protein [Chitinophagaceae bacterium]|nr:four helix bundle protein [Chitinophagaceae bacterium]